MLQFPEAFQYIKLVFVNKKGKLLTAHRSTNYLCCLPTLEDLSGAGRIRLARLQRYIFIHHSNLKIRLKINLIS